MSVAQVTKKGQILIPKKLRETVGLEPGGKAQLLVGEKGIVVRPAPKDPIAAAAGFLKGKFSLTRDLLKERKEEKKREEKHRS